MSKDVAFDSSILLVAIRKDDIAASVDKAKERVAYLVSELSKTGARIIVPTPALSEVLVHAGNAASTYLEELQRSSRFKISPFDTKAAIEVAIDIAASVKKGDKKGGAKGTWAKANFDRQIAAIAKSAGAHKVFTDDDDVEKHAKRMGLQVERLHDLPLPPSNTPLLDAVKAEPLTFPEANRAEDEQREENQPESLDERRSIRLAESEPPPKSKQTKKPHKTRTKLKPTKQGG